jgi:hypothetical protein
MVVFGASFEEGRSPQTTSRPECVTDPPNKSADPTGGLSEKVGGRLPQPIGMQSQSSSKPQPKGMQSQSPSSSSDSAVGLQNAVPPPSKVSACDKLTRTVRLCPSS